MPFIPHTEEDIQAMLAAVGAASMEALFDEIPSSLKRSKLDRVPLQMSEQEVTRLMLSRAAADGRYLNFIGAGAYEHHIPAAVWQLATRGEFYSAYTPYQAEASQGTLQVLYEYQSMMAALTALPVSNAGLYDGASALAEAILMAVRAHKSSRRVLLPKTVHPHYAQVVRAIVRQQAIELIELPWVAGEGHTDPERVSPQHDFAALVIPQPNFFGVLEEVDLLTARAHENGAFAIGLVNPISLALLKPPGNWGDRGADIAVGEGQPLGIPLSSGGPYFGFMVCQEPLLRQMPGRLVGRTVDLDGKPGFTLTLQAREQHIRRGKATSNICTNQGLMVTAATIYMSLLGPEGIKRVARDCHAKLHALLEKLDAIPGVQRAFSRPLFHEAVIKLPMAVAPVLRELMGRGILAGLDLGGYYPELGEALLVCTTETRNEQDLQAYAQQLSRVLNSAPQP
jgi:glycine dehydrogenase subunit 1